MAITVVDTATGVANNGGDATVTLGGSEAEDDLVLVGGMFPGTGDPDDPLPTTAGYTQAGSTVDDGTNGKAAVAYKVMGATPDTTIVGKGTGDLDDANAYSAVTLRGIDTTTPLDVAVTTATGSGTDPNPASITTSTDGAVVVVFSFRFGSNNAADGAPSGYSNLAAVGEVDTNRASAALATKEVATAGVEDAGVFSYPGPPSGDWITFTVAIRSATGGGPTGSPHNYYAQHY